MIIKFACITCRLKEVMRIYNIDKDANVGKRFRGKQKSLLKEENFLREASEVIFLKNTQLDYGTISNAGSNDPEYPQSEINASVKDGWAFKCPVCEQYSIFQRGFGNL